MKEFRPGIPKEAFRPARYFPPDSVDYHWTEWLAQMKNLGSTEIVKCLARRMKELKDRGYPDEWIEKEIWKIVEAL